MKIPFVAFGALAGVWAVLLIVVTVALLVENGIFIAGKYNLALLLSCIFGVVFGLCLGGALWWRGQIGFRALLLFISVCTVGGTFAIVGPVYLLRATDLMDIPHFKDAYSTLTQTLRFALLGAMSGAVCATVCTLGSVPLLKLRWNLVWLPIAVGAGMGALLFISMGWGSAFFAMLIVWAAAYAGALGRIRNSAAA